MNPSISLYYTNIVENELHNLLKKWRIIDFDFPPRNMSKEQFRQECLKLAKQYFYKHNTKAKIYKFNGGFALKYDGVNGMKISKGTAFQNVIVNLYRSTLWYRSHKISTIRFGTPVYKNLTYQFRKIKELFEGKRTIYASLLTSTTWKIRFKQAFKVATIEEPRIVEHGYKTFSRKNEISPLFIQMSHVPIISTGRSSDFSLIQEWLDEEGINYTIPPMDLGSGKNIFDNIIEISKIHWLLNNHAPNKYNLGFHCKSGKDRTSLFDAINKATQLVLYQNNGRINKNKIRKYSRFFLLFGLMIANRSTANFGLKLSKTLGHVTKDFLTPNDVKWFEGIAFYI